MPDRIVYPAIRKMDFIPKSDTKDVPFFYHHDHDARHWLRQGHGRHAALYKSDRPSPSRTNPSYSATPMYDAHVTGPKSGMTTAMKNSDRRYASDAEVRGRRHDGDGARRHGRARRRVRSPQTTARRRRRSRPPRPRRARGGRQPHSRTASRIPPRGFMTQSYGSHCGRPASATRRARATVRCTPTARLGRSFGESPASRARRSGLEPPRTSRRPGRVRMAMTDATAWRPPARTGARSTGATHIWPAVDVQVVEEEDTAAEFASRDVSEELNFYANQLGLSVAC